MTRSARALTPGPGFLTIRVESGRGSAEKGDTMGESAPEATGGEVVLKTKDLLAERIVVEGQGDGGVCYRFSGRARSSEPEFVDGLGKLREKIAAQERPVSLDLSGIEQVNSAFIGLIVGLVAKLDEKGRRLAVVGANRQVKDLLGIVGILDALDIRDT